LKADVFRRRSLNIYTHPHTVPRQWLPLYWSHCQHNKRHKQCFIIDSKLRIVWSGFRFLARAIHLSLLQNVLSASGTLLDSVQWVPVIRYPGINSSIVKLTTDLHRMTRLRINGAIYLLTSCAFMASTSKIYYALFACLYMHYVYLFTFSSLSSQFVWLIVSCS
jgi:hypothetical protein